MDKWSWEWNQMHLANIHKYGAGKTEWLGTSKVRAKYWVTKGRKWHSRVMIEIYHGGH